MRRFVAAACVAFACGGSATPHPKSMATCVDPLRKLTPTAAFVRTDTGLVLHVRVVVSDPETDIRFDAVQSAGIVSREREITADLNVPPDATLATLDVSVRPCGEFESGARLRVTSRWNEPRSIATRVSSEITSSPATP
jgi:hypothetical protein